MGAAIPTARPAQVDIRPRRMDFVFDQNTPRHWLGGDPFLTHLFNALSLTFPEGERFFVDSVRLYRDRIMDPAQQKDVSGFIGQEAFHSREHEALNQWLAEQGYPVGELERRVKKLLSFPRRFAPMQRKLAITCALEHLTAILANDLLQHSDVRERIHPAMRPLWEWHALEESEHKAVAFDVYRAHVGGYMTRVLVLVLATSMLMLVGSYFQYRLLKVDGLHRRPGLWLRGVWSLWRPGGMLFRIVPAWLAYFRPGFHPWQNDNRDLIQRYQKQFDNEKYFPSGVIHEGKN